MTDLYAQIVCEQNLLAAWARVRQGGKAPGLDRVSLPQFDFHLDRELIRLRQELRTGTYRPWPARRVRLPKADGGVRLIGVQAVRDRLAQRALLNLLQPRVEPVLEACSYAFRPGRSVEMALARLDLWRQESYSWVARADIETCFDSLDRELLDLQIRQVVSEADVRELIALWLNAGYVDEVGWSESGIGAPQGDVLSPILCNLYLDRFDEAVQNGGHPLVRFADDFAILGRTEQEARHGLERADASLSALRLKRNLQKSRVVSFIQGFEYLGAAIAGSLMLPVVRIERPGRRPLYTYGYERTPSAAASVRLIPHPDEAETLPDGHRFRDQMVGLLRAERSGRELPAVAAALLEAWQKSGQSPGRRSRREPEGWQSVYLI